MSEKKLRRFQNLRDAHDKAVQARKEAAGTRKAIKGLGGLVGDIAALASDISSQAVKAELACLRAERKALNQLHAYAAKVARAGASKTGEESGDWG